MFLCQLLYDRIQWLFFCYLLLLCIICDCLKFLNREPPKFLGRPRIIKENDDKTIVLELDCEGDLKDVAWLKDGDLIKNAGRYLIEFSETSSKMHVVVLEIDNVNPGDAGSYTCVAKNKSGDSERNVVLRPEDCMPQVANNEIAPSFKEKPKDQVGVDGDRIVVSSKVLGNPRPEVTWYKEKQPLQKSGVS